MFDLNVALNDPVSHGVQGRIDNWHKGGGENGGDHKGEHQLTFLPNFPANHSKLRKNCR